jgi:hypothetical protein
VPRLFAFHETDRGAAGPTKDREHIIRCPKCGWRPHKEARWACACGHTWNTFDTRGICPECYAAWKDTQCLRCHTWSLHESWYSARGPDE